MTKSIEGQKTKRSNPKPRLHTPLLKGKSLSDEVSALADRIGMPLMPWQKWVFDDMMKVDADGMFRRKTIGLLAARQNGKTHIARMRILYGLIKGERIVAMSSNRNMALDTFREVAYIIQTNDFLAEQLAHKPRLAKIGRAHV